MSKKIFKRIGRALLNCGPKTITKVNFAPVNYGNILSSKKVIITGGSKGIGYAMAKKFISEGAHVIITGRTEETLKKACDTLGNNCSYIVYDATDIKDIDLFLQRCTSIFGEHPNVLVCNAGISLHESSFEDVTESSFDKQFNTNFKSVYFLTKSFISSFNIDSRTNDNNVAANILIVSSETGDMAYDIPYGMTKASLNSMVGGISRRCYKKRIRINAISPGLTMTNLIDQSEITRDNLTVKGQASGRIFLPEEVAEVACFLISDSSICISGEVIHCNAGNHLRTNISE